jgi:hypothetical protein
VPVTPSTGARARAAGADRPRERARTGEAIALRECRDGVRKRLREVDVGRRDDLVDHPLQPQLLAILGRKNARDAIRVQRIDLRADDDAATAAEDLDVPGAALAQQVEHVGEELDVPALIR